MKLRQHPPSLIAVAVLFIIMGVLSVIEILVSLTNNTLSYNFGVLGLFIGFGLLRLRRVWRIWALVIVWIAFIVTPITVILCVVFWEKLGKAGLLFGFTYAAALFAVSLWAYHVLTRSDVRRLFRLPGA